MDNARLTTVMGVARALLMTQGPEVTASALVAEYGWDRSFQSLALLRDPAAAAAFGRLWEELVLAPLADDMVVPSAQ